MGISNNKLITLEYFLKKVSVEETSYFQFGGEKSTNSIIEKLPSHKNFENKNTNVPNTKVATLGFKS